MISLSKIYSGGRGANENRLRFGAGMVVRHGRRPADYPQNAAKRFVAGRMSQKMCTWKFWQGTPKNTPWFEICAFGSSPTSSHGLWERESGKRLSMSDPTRQPHLVCHIRFRLIAGCFMGQTSLSDSAILIERPNRCWTDHPDLCKTNHFLGNFENPCLVCYDTNSH